MKKFNSIMSIFLVFVITIGMISSFGVFASAVNTTISLDDAVSDSGKNMMKDSSASFTATNGFTEDTKSIIMANNFEETAMGHKYGSATLTREADPSTRTAYAMKFTATPGTGNPRCQLTNNVEWGGDTYSQYGMKDDRTIIAKVDLYLPQEAFDEMTNAMRYELTLGSANIDGIYGLGSVKITKPNPADTTFTANCDTVKRQLTPNTWYNIKYIYQPGASSIKVYLNDELFNTRSVPPENKIMSTSVANGFRFVAVKGTKITNGVYFDNAEIYQMEKLIGIKSMSFNETSGELFIDFETNINASELDKIILKHSNENVTNLITSRRILSNAHNAILNLNASNMVIGGEYSVELPVGFTDMNEQFIKEIYKKNFIASSPKAVYIDDSLTTFTAPSASGASASVTFKTEESIAKNAWVSMAVFGAYNELISIDTKNISVLEPFKADFSVATDCSNATKIMIFSWDSENGMVPYEKSKMIWGNQ